MFPSCIRNCNGSPILDLDILIANELVVSFTTSLRDSFRFSCFRPPIDIIEIPKDTSVCMNSDITITGPVLFPRFMIHYAELTSSTDSKQVVCYTIPKEFKSAYFATSLGWSFKDLGNRYEIDAPSTQNEKSG